MDQDEVIPLEYTTYFRSAIAFGKIRIITDDAKKRQALVLLGRKYHPTDSAEGLTKAIDAEFPATCMMEMTIEHLTGKEAIELVREKKAEAPNQ